MNFGDSEMGKLIVDEPLASQILDEAKNQDLTVEEFLKNAVYEVKSRVRRAKINAETTWWESVNMATRKKYEGQFVAVHEQTVVDYDTNEEILRDRIRKNYGNTPIPIMPWTGVREIRVVSFCIEPT